MADSVAPLTPNLERALPLMLCCAMGAFNLLVSFYMFGVAATANNGGEDNPLTSPVTADAYILNFEEVVMLESAVSILEAGPNKLFDKLAMILTVTDLTVNENVSAIQLEILNEQLTPEPEILPDLWKQCQLALLVLQNDNESLDVDDLVLMEWWQKDRKRSRSRGDKRQDLQDRRRRRTAHGTRTGVRARRPDPALPQREHCLKGGRPSLHQRP